MLTIQQCNIELASLCTYTKRIIIHLKTMDKS